MKKLIFFLFTAFLSIPLLFSQENLTRCGTIVKNDGQSLPLPPNGILESPKVIYDRFGNTYTSAELSIKTNLATCDGGHFELFFDGNFSQDEQNIICQAFKDISAEILLLPVVPPATNPKAKVSITKSALGAQIHAAASPFYDNSNVNCEKNVENNYVWRSLYVKNDLKSNKVYDGVLYFNSDYGTTTTPKAFNWHTNLTTNPPANYLDLYTIALHEALHIVGFASSINNNGDPYSSYTVWDKQLFSKVLNEKIILSQPTSNCCGGHQKNSKFNYIIDILRDCNKSDGVVMQSPEVKIYGTPIVGNLTNSMSHLCNSLDPMYPTYGFGAARKNLTNDDKAVLCKIGYKGKNCDAYACIVQANNDFFTIPKGTSSYVLPKESILANDFANTSSTLKFKDIKNVILNGNDYTFTLVPGQNIFYYDLSGCDGLCSSAAVYINSFPTCAPSAGNCNLVCGGDFENATKNTVDATTNFRCHQYINSQGVEETQNSIELYQNNTDLIPSINPIRGSFNTGQFNTSPRFFCLPEKLVQAIYVATVGFQFNGVANQYTIPSVPANTKFIHIGMNDYNTGISKDYFEAVLFELKDKLTIGQEYEISFDKFSGCSHSINFSFTKNLPCEKTNSIFPALFNSTPVNNCKDLNGDNITFGVPQIINIPYGSDLAVGNPYQAKWSKVSGIKFTANEESKYLIVFINPDASPSYESQSGKSLFLDNIAVNAVLPPTTVTSIIKQDCNKNKISVEYKVCFPPNLIKPYKVILQPNPTIGLLPSISSGNFAGGNVTIDVPVSDKSLCQTLTLDLEVQSNIPLGAYLPIELNIVSNDICILNNKHITDFNTDYLDLKGNLTKSSLYQKFPKIYSGQVSSTLRVSQDLIIDANYSFNNVTFLIESGVKISILENISATFNNCQFYTCGDKTWQGIEVLAPIKGNAGGTIYLTDCPRIEDAEVAVKLNNKTTATITGNTFSKNNVNVSIENAELSAFTSYNNTHDALKKYLKIPFTGPAPKGVRRTYTAYWLKNASLRGGTLSIGSPLAITKPTKAAEAISGQLNGIVAENSSLITNFVSFANISQSNNYTVNSLLPEGYAIHSKAAQIGNALLVNGIDKTQVLFEKCENGVFSNNIRTTVQKNGMTGMGNGINCQASILGKTSATVTDNGIEGSNSGVTLSGLNVTDVRNNKIAIISSSASSGAAINIFNCGIGSTSPLVVTNNAIEMTNIAYGIRLNTCQNMHIINNKNIQILGSRKGSPTLFTDGINIINTWDSKFYENEIRGVSPTNPANNDPISTPETVGLFMQTSSTNNFCCNTIAHTYTGLEARGLNNIEGNLRGTSFNRHNTGLYIRFNDSSVGLQDHVGTIWNNFLPIAAKNDNNSFIHYKNNPFLIEKVIVIPPLPPLTFPTIFPDLVLVSTPIGIVNSTWFVEDNSKNSIVCNSKSNCGFPPLLKPNFNDTEFAFLKSENPKDEFGELGTWQLSRSLYAKISANPALLEGNELAVMFFEQSKNSNISTFVGIDEGLSYVRSYQSTELDEIEKQVEDKNKEIVIIDTQLATTEKKEVLLKEREIIINALDKVKINLNLVIMSDVSTKKELLQDLLERNGNINSEFENELNIKTLNEAMINFALSNNLTPDLIEKLEKVANQCDLTGGEAVQTARAFLEIQMPHKYGFGRENQCGTTFYSKQQKSNNSIDAKIYPNPSDGNVILDKGQLTIDQIELYSINGHLIERLIISDQFTPINISYLNDGIYYCRLLDNNKEVSHLKVTIIR
jgi:hypothetical protein